MSDPIRSQRRGPVLEVTIDRPKANAIDAPTSCMMGEVFAGFRDDPALRVAILTEVLKDAVTLLLPTSRQEIERALGRLRIAALIDGFRGRKGDRAAVIGAIEAVARFAQAHGPYIEELDVNPLMVLPPGQGAVAVDALLRLRTGD